MKPKVHASTRFAALLALFALLGILATGAYAGPNDGKNDTAKDPDAAKWEVFSKNLVHALRSDNEGVRVGALQMIIRYGDHLDVGEAVIDVMRLYRNHPDDDVRRMAVVALGKMKSGRAIGYLRLSADYETSPTVRRTIRSVLARYAAARSDAAAGV